ncbi:YoaK family protein [Rhizobium miluonense]|uniref:Uncharacterized membrane protein YoaK, UPF0700 family n=1 Tax=Rhizobium miluonense TaxID=411945 RepID=A0A1C3VM45_9HYPH|nr:YoaK family protein [Rhizobium miluonense]SCB28799.1 Uncharacterized membrane protein YoaK, UPF0700 family [Rhizobium miluonense]
MKGIPLSILLSLNGGYVDTVGFLALQGLFTAHVTGNFVTLGAAVAMGTAGALPKLLALPVFCVVVLLSRIVSIQLQRAGWPVLRPLLAVKLILLIAAAAFAIVHGGFADANSGAALAMGMTLVAAMAIQNGLHRVHLSKSPPSTLMTGTTTQIMLDLAEVLVTRGESAATALKRSKRMALSVLTFAFGCAAAAVAFILSPVWCFVVPAVLGALMFVAKIETPEGD